MCKMMHSYNKTDYNKVVLGLTTVALTTSQLDALVVGTFFEGGLEVQPNTVSASYSGPQKYSFGFNLQGDYTPSKGGFKAISADHAFFASRFTSKTSNGEYMSNGYRGVASQAKGTPKATLVSGSTIGPSTSFPDSQLIRDYQISDAPGAAATDTGPLAGAASGRGSLALRFGTGTEGEYRYGWADITLSDTNFTIHGFGFETTPDTAIEYGAVGTIPEVKQSALLLGLGAMGVAALRKRKRNVA
jgi:hypothetical protein